MDISNVVNTKVAKFCKYQPHGGIKSVIICKKYQNRERKKYLSYQTVLASLACKIQHLNVSQMKIAAKNVAKVFLYIEMHKSLGKIKLVLR